VALVCAQQVPLAIKSLSLPLLFLFPRVSQVLSTLNGSAFGGGPLAQKLRLNLTSANAQYLHSYPGASSSNGVAQPTPFPRPFSTTGGQGGSHSSSGGGAHSVPHALASQRGAASAAAAAAFPPDAFSGVVSTPPASSNQHGGQDGGVGSGGRGSGGGDGGGRLLLDVWPGAPSLTALTSPSAFVSPSAAQRSPGHIPGTTSAGGSDASGGGTPLFRVARPPVPSPAQPSPEIRRRAVGILDGALTQAGAGRMGGGGHGGMPGSGRGGGSGGEVGASGSGGLPGMPGGGEAKADGPTALSPPRTSPADLRNQQYV